MIFEKKRLVGEGNCCSYDFILEEFSDEKIFER